ncbi:MAG: LysR family transcriptional regulator [Clostridia bacterium]|nr:LysR family transcriptional regulator [Clostridia bacterium]
MNPKQLQYAIELAKTCNFSKASEKLNITQPALSKQIMLLEKDLGVKLFDRNCAPLRLTPAGEHFIREAKELLYKEEQLKRSLESFSTGERGRLVIGASPFRSLYLIPAIVKKVRERFPGVEISLYDTNSEQIRKDVIDGKLDFAIVNLPVDDSVLEYTPIEPDALVLAVPNEMLGEIPNAPSGNLAEIVFKDCAELPFVVVDPSKEMRVLFDRLCAASDFHPHIAMEVAGITTAWAMAQAGIGATLVPLQFIGEGALCNGEITLFKIKDNTYRRQPVIVTRRGQHLSKYAEFAINLLIEEKQD